MRIISEESWITMEDYGAFTNELILYEENGNTFLKAACGYGETNFSTTWEVEILSGTKFKDARIFDYKGDNVAVSPNDHPEDVEDMCESLGIKLKCLDIINKKEW